MAMEIIAHYCEGDKVAFYFPMQPSLDGCMVDHASMVEENARKILRQFVANGGKLSNESWIDVMMSGKLPRFKGVIGDIEV